MFIFRSKHLYVYDKRTNEIKDITEKIKGEQLFWMSYGTSTVVNNRVINTVDNGT